MRPVTPRGFRDCLPREALERERLVRRANDVFDRWGYDPIETPVLEVYETLVTAAGDLEGTAFRLFDSDGRLLALRPDMTMPIARVVSSRLGDEPGARRFRYAGQVFREHESLRGQSRQFTQVGVELVGAGGPYADAEVVSVIVETLSSCGLESFTVAVGDVAVLRAVLGAASAGPDWERSVLAAVHRRDLVSFDRLSREAGVPVVAGEALRSLVRLRGGSEAIGAAANLLESVGVGGVLDDLAATWSVLEASGAADRVRVDFGVMRDFDYYTGIVLEVLAPGIGLPVGGGGRYDDALAAFGTPMPAAGFALGLERLTIALAEQGADFGETPELVLVGGEPLAAFAEAAERRAAGERVSLAAGLTGSELESAALSAGAKAVEA